ncbi:PREDICTED: uncharacterized protein LOC107328833 [Acropora digitifera]|uniref:uncharacterized protein LOC107328833 n=1 Tax=Acropora digitifera TaxID=70779 RepID=UPI00077A5C4C|nr:PREDICTED: uncharacterized protein LOC107328833 [Acropora digitifera]
MADARLSPEASSPKRGLGGIVRNMALKSNIHCCVPLCTQRGRVAPKGEQIGFFKFPDEEQMKKQWIHAIRRDVGRFFRISRAMKVCSLHFKLSDISKGLGGRMSLKTRAVPSIFAWKQTSPRKRPPPTERPYQQQRKDRPKSVPEKECFSVSSEPKILLSKTPEAVNDIPETGTNETITLGAASTSLDEMPSTEKDLNETLKQLRLLENKCQKPPRIPEFYTLTKIHKNTPVGRPIVSGSSGPTERISSFVDSLLQPIAQKQQSYIKDTTHFINFIENTPLPDGAVLATFDVCSLYTNIPQEEGIEVVCQYYQEHYQSKTPIPTQSLGELMRLILKENSSIQ